MDLERPEWEGEPAEYEPGSYRVKDWELEAAAAAARQRRQPTSDDTEVRFEFALLGIDECAKRRMGVYHALLVAHDGAA